MKKSLVFTLLCGYVLGKAGKDIFGSKTAKTVYTELATGAIIAKDYVMSNVETFQALASDITTDAKSKVEAYYLKKDAEYCCSKEAATVAEGEE